MIYSFVYSLVYSLIRVVPSRYCFSSFLFPCCFPGSPAVSTGKCKLYRWSNRCLPFESLTIVLWCFYPHFVYDRRNFLPALPEDATRCLDHRDPMVPTPTGGSHDDHVTNLLAHKKGMQWFLPRSTWRLPAPFTCSPSHLCLLSWCWHWLQVHTLYPASCVCTPVLGDRGFIRYQIVLADLHCGKVNRTIGGSFTAGVLQMIWWSHSKLR